MRRHVKLDSSAACSQFLVTLACLKGLLGNQHRGSLPGTAVLDAWPTKITETCYGLKRAEISALATQSLTAPFNKPSLFSSWALTSKEPSAGIPFIDIQPGPDILIVFACPQTVMASPARIFNMCC